MPKILELDPHVADLIAAGEVVERPASVIKELMENSIDAGAGIITVEITAGGLTYIRVTDNGCGIAPEDTTTAFLRHATSKLRGAEGLEAIGTLGFRGEALAAIAAVSRIELLTRETGAREGVSLSLVAGAVTDISPAGCPEGTTIIVRDLFFNTPARLKFVKSDRAESSSVASAVLRCALSHPEVSVRFIRDGKTEYHTPGDSRIDSCLYSLFGRDFSAGLIGAESSDEAIAVIGFVSTPAAARGNRSYQFFFVNGRSIRSITLQTALERAYANTLPSGRFPACALYITTKLSNVDVNVHPAKTEVKFVSDKQVFDGVYYAALSAVTRGGNGSDNIPGAVTRGGNGSGTVPSAVTRSGNGSSTVPSSDFGSQDSELDANVSSSGQERSGFSSTPVGCEQRGLTSIPVSSEHNGFPSASDYNGQRVTSINGSQTGYSDQTPRGHVKMAGDGFRTMQVDEYQRKYGSGGHLQPASGTLSEATITPSPSLSQSPQSSSQSLSQSSQSLSSPSLPSPSPSLSPSLPQSPSSSPENSEFQIFGSGFSNTPFRVIGETLNTYIIVEYRGSVWFIDKHAAHERIHFNALRDDDYEPMSQALITPVICRHGCEDVSVLLEHSELLEKLGFSVESFGDDAVAVRRIPAEIDIGDAEPALSEICAELKLGGPAEPVRRDNILRTVACKAAIKAGRSSGIRELETLAARVISGEISQCPHGRPVSFELTKPTLDKWFKRI